GSRASAPFAGAPVLVEWPPLDQGGRRALRHAPLDRLEPLDPIALARGPERHHGFQRRTAGELTRNLRDQNRGFPAEPEPRPRPFPHPFQGGGVFGVALERAKHSAVSPWGGARAWLQSIAGPSWCPAAEVRDTWLHARTRTSEAKGHQQVYGSSAAFRFEVPIRACGRRCRNFKSAALVCAPAA